MHSCVHQIVLSTFYVKDPQAPLISCNTLQIYRNPWRKKVEPMKENKHSIFNDLSEVIQLFECHFTAKHYYPSMYVPFLTRILSCTEAPVSFSWNFHCFEELIPHFLCLEELRTLHIPLLSSLQSCLFSLNNLLTPDGLCIASSERVTHLLVKLPLSQMINSTGNNNNNKNMANTCTTLTLY